jgi:D-sedoheptulose 7-phosphate isomerase
MTKSLFSAKVEVLRSLLHEVDNLHSDEFSSCVAIFLETLRKGNTVFWCGNGGSAAESSHLAAELVGRFRTNRMPLPSISLNADTSVITCIANDFGYDQVFARQLEGLAKPGDLLVVLSTSGMSENISRAVEKAKDLGVTTIALLGKGGGRVIDLVDVSIVIKSNETARIQELHLFIGHTLCEYAELEFGLGN